MRSKTKQQVMVKYSNVNIVIKNLEEVVAAFVQYVGDGPMIMEKVVHIPKYVKPWYIYQLILSQLS